MILGKCPYCDGNVLYFKTIINGVKTSLYTCENCKKEHDESGAFVYTNNSSCSFRFYSNALRKWNKRTITKNEVKQLLNDKQVIIKLLSKFNKTPYYKYLIPDKDYGISILWEEEVEKQLS